MVYWIKKLNKPRYTSFLLEVSKWNMFGNMEKMIIKNIMNVILGKTIYV